MSVALFHREDGHPDGPPVLMVHAFPTSHALWEPQLPALSPRFRLIRPDLRGLGKSPAAPRPYTMEDMAGDLIALMDRLRIDTFHYIGISMGGMLGQIIALDYPQRLLSLSLLMTTSEIPPEAPPSDDPAYAISQRLMRGGAARALSEGMEPIAAMCLDRWFSPDFINSAAAQRVGRIVAANTPEGYAGGVDALCGFDVTARLPAVKVPTLVLAGEQDLGTPPRCSEVIAARIPGARLEVISHARHIASVEQPQAVNEALLAHLQVHD
jgi:3-oxoadipate enol-lactonase